MALEPKQILESDNVTPSLTSAVACQQGPAVGSPSGYATIEQIKDVISNNPLPTITISSSTQTLDFSASVFFIKNTSNGNYTMPLASGNNGKGFTVKKLSDDPITATLILQGSDNFFTTDLFTTISLTKGASVTLISDGNSTWYVI